VNLFQWLTIPALLVLAIWEVAHSMRPPRRAGWPRLRAAIWATAAVAIAAPDAMTHLAGMVGIQRGTDLVLYGLVFVFLGTTFFLYSRYARLRREVIELVRQQAIHEACFGSESAAHHDVRKAA
jgi:hypothetical protein